MARVRKIGHPKHKKKPQRKAHAYSILQEDPSFCYLCAKAGDNLPQRTEEHHIFFGTGQRDKSEAQGLDRKSTRRNSSHPTTSRMPSSA